MIRVLVALLLTFAGFSSHPALADDQTIIRAWAVAEFGEPGLDQATFEHWPYANPNAPVGGTVTLAEYGGFDSFNTWISRGEWQNTNIGLTRDALMVGSADEIGVVYGQIAEFVEYPEDVSWAIFHIRPEARWHDGTPITAGDFKFAFDLLKEEGRPFLRVIFEPLASAEVLDDRRIKFSFTTRNQKKALVLAAGLSPEPQHWWAEEGRDPTKTYLEPPLGSGSYRLVEVDPGRRLVYERVPDYWGWGLKTMRGIDNFHRIIYEYYRDQDVMFEAFKGGGYDFRTEGSELRWATGYDIPAVRDGAIRQRTVPVKAPRGVQAYFINTRRPHLADVRVREALNLLYDFEWIQKTILFGFNERSETYFINSDYSATGLPTGKELEFLEPFRAQLPERLFTEPFDLPETDASGRNRRLTRQALRLFGGAGWQVQNGRMVNQDGEQLRIELLTVTQDSERWTQPYVENLRRVGIDARIFRVPDSATWQRRADDFDFDLFTAVYTFYPPPGTELVSRFHSSEADVPGSANLTGIKNEAVDALLERIVSATDYETLVQATRALDRVLLWNYLIVPHWHRSEAWLAFQDKFGYPDRNPRYGVGFNTWWVKSGIE